MPSSCIWKHPAPYITDEETEEQGNERRGDPRVHSSLGAEVLLEPSPQLPVLDFLTTLTASAYFNNALFFFFFSCLFVSLLWARRACGSASLGLPAYVHGKCLGVEGLGLSPSTAFAHSI